MRKVLVAVLLAGMGFSSLASLTYMVPEGEGPWDWTAAANWYNNEATGATVNRLPKASDTISLYDESLSRGALRVSAGTGAICSEFYIGALEKRGVAPSDGSPILFEICGGAVTNCSPAYLGWRNAQVPNGPRSAKLKISSGSWTSLGNFNLAGANLPCWLDIGKSGVLDVSGRTMAVGYANRATGIVTNEGSIVAANLFLGNDPGSSMTAYANYTTGIVVNAGSIVVTNETKLGIAANSSARIENRGTMTVGNVYFGDGAGADSEFDNYGTLVAGDTANKTGRFYLGNGANGGTCVFRIHKGATFTKKCPSDYRWLYAGSSSPAVLSVDGGSFVGTAANDRIFVSVNAKGASGSRLEVINGGTLSFAGKITLPLQTGTTAELLVSGAGSTVSNCTLSAGQEWAYHKGVSDGVGDIVVTNGAKIASAKAIYLGYSHRAVGRLTVTDGGQVVSPQVIEIGKDCKKPSSEAWGSATGLVTVVGSASVITNVGKMLIGQSDNSFGRLKLEGGKVFCNTNGSGIALGVAGSSSMGEICGWGVIAHDWAGDGVWVKNNFLKSHFGKVIADGEGVERDLNMANMLSLNTDAAEIQNSIGVNGWYARNKGRLMYPNLHVFYKKSSARCVGDCASRDLSMGDPRLVNSFQYVMTGAKSDNLYVWAELYATDRSDIPAGIPSSGDDTVLSVHRAGYFREYARFTDPVTPIAFDTVSVKFHYDLAKAGSHTRVRVYHHDGTATGKWTRVGQTTVASDDPYVSTTDVASSSAKWNWGWFAIVADDPMGMIMIVK